jgi:hypothetical protein
MSKEYIKGMGRVEIPLSLEPPEYDFKLGKKRRKIPNPLVELMYPPPKQGLLNKYSLKQLKDAITEMNDMGLTNVQGFSQIGRPELVNLILKNSKYFGIPAVKIIGKERTYYNYEDQKDDKRYNKWSDYFDVEEDVKKYDDIKMKKEKRKKQREEGIPDIGIWDKLFSLSKEEQKRKEIDDKLRKELEKLKKDVNNKSLQNKILKEEEKRKEIDDKLKVELEKLKKEIEGVKRENIDEKLLKEFEKLKSDIKGKKREIISENLKSKVKKELEKNKVKDFLKEANKSLKYENYAIDAKLKKLFDNLTEDEQKEVENNRDFQTGLGYVSGNVYTNTRFKIEEERKRISRLNDNIDAKKQAIKANKEFKTKKALEKGKKILN